MKRKPIKRGADGCLRPTKRQIRAGLEYGRAVFRGEPARAPVPVSYLVAALWCVAEQYRATVEREEAAIRAAELAAAAAAGGVTRLAQELARWIVALPEAERLERLEAWATWGDPRVVRPVDGPDPPV